MRRICRILHPLLGDKLLAQINGDAVWSIIERLSRRGTAPATVNRYLATIRGILRMARDEWQWIDSFPKIKLPRARWRGIGG